MKNRNYIAAAAIVGAMAIVGCRQQQPDLSDVPLPQSSSAVDANNSATPASRTKLDKRTEMALLDALADERRAEAAYKAVIARFGDVRPFSNIVNAEKRHESFLLPLFEKYGVPVPENQIVVSQIEVPATPAEACRRGIDGEKSNIVMYDKFLEFVREEDIRQVFTYLRDASKNNHLPAFERCASGGGGRRGGRINN
jgi:rubrerythrin